MFSDIDYLWREAVRFHGHACPGLAIGCRMVFEAARELELGGKAKDEELVCVTETDACCVDAVQALLGCTLGKGNLLLKLRGKAAMHFYARKLGKGLRLVWQGAAENVSREDKIALILGEAGGDLFLRQALGACPLPEALLSPSIACTQCGERTSEAMLRFKQGQAYCLDCYPNHSRIL